MEDPQMRTFFSLMMLFNKKYVFCTDRFKHREARLRSLCLWISMALGRTCRFVPRGSGWDF